MKHLSLGIVLSLITVFVVAIILTVDTRTTREKELQDSLERALSVSLDKASLDNVDGQYSDDDMKRMAEETIRKNITAPQNDKNYALDVKILTSDVKNGLLSARVKETYTNPNGKPISIETERTIAVESESEKKAYKLYYKIPSEDAENLGVPETVSEYTICENESVKVPEIGVFEGYIFKGFFDEEDGLKYSEEDLKNKKMDRSLDSHVLLLKYESDGSPDGPGKINTVNAETALSEGNAGELHTVTKKPTLSSGLNGEIHTVSMDIAGAKGIKGELHTVKMKPAYTGAAGGDIDASGKEGGSSGKGSYVYKFSYEYCHKHMAIELSVRINKEDGSLYKNFTFHSPNDKHSLNTINPSLLNGKTLDKAIDDMIKDLNIKDYDREAVKNIIEMKFHFTEDARKIWAYPIDNGKRFYLVHVTAKALLGAEGSVALTVLPGKGVLSTYGSGIYPAGTVVKYGGVQKFGYAKPLEQEITLTKDTIVTVESIPWSHILHFDPNGGDSAPEDIIKVFGELAKVPVYIPNRDTYHFDYWSTVYSDPVEMGSDYDHDQDGGVVTLIAHWKSYISYDTTTGLSNLSQSLSATSFGEDTMHDGGSVSVTKKPSVSYNGVDVSRSVIFIGWNTEKYGRGEWFSHDMNGASGSFSYGGGDLKLYAQYRIKYDMLYDGNNQTEGDNIIETREDGVEASASGSTFKFPENPFVKYEEKKLLDENIKETVDYIEKYSFQGWSLNNQAYFTDDKVYHCPNKNRINGDTSEAGIRDYLSECLSWNPCENISIADSYITVKTFAVWDKYPYVHGFDIAFLKENIEGLSDEDMKTLFIESAKTESLDFEDGIRSDIGNPIVKIYNFKREDFIPDNDFGTAVCTLMVTDHALNSSYYQIKVHVTTKSFETSKEDKNRKAVVYKRFIDEENYKKSFENYNTVNETALSESERKKAHDRGGMESYSKWVLDFQNKEKMKMSFSQG